jgi:ribosomal protein S18 acetylase RimI-like enzyme
MASVVHASTQLAIVRADPSRPPRGFESLQPAWGALGAASFARRGESFLALADRGRAVGLLSGVAIAGTFEVSGLYAAQRRRDEVLAALLEHVRGERSGQAVELLVEPAPESGALAEALAGAGFDLVLDQIQYSANLRAVATSPVPAELDFRPCAGLPQADLLAALETVWDGRPPAGRDPGDELELLLRHATRPDGRTDISLWRLAFADDRLVGALLPALVPGADGLGVLLYVGVVPAERGRGLGGALYGQALAALRRAGAVRYKDATARSNEAMVRLFERAGCVPAGSSRLYRAVPLRPEPGTLAGVAEIEAHLESRGHACAETLRGRGLSVMARRGAARAEIVIEVDRGRRRLRLQARAGEPAERTVPFRTGRGCNPGALDTAVSELLTAAGSSTPSAPRRPLAIPIEAGDATRREAADGEPVATRPPPLADTTAATPREGG